MILLSDVVVSNIQAKPRGLRNVRRLSPVHKRIGQDSTRYRTLRDVPLRLLSILIVHQCSISLLFILVFCLSCVRQLLNKRIRCMTNYELLRWLVDTLSRNVDHYRMINASRSTVCRYNDKLSVISLVPRRSTACICCWAPCCGVLLPQPGVCNRRAGLR